MQEKLRVLTFNIRNTTDRWIERKSLLHGTIKNINAEIIGK